MPRCEARGVRVRKYRSQISLVDICRTQTLFATRQDRWSILTNKDSDAGSR
jgi:hypothetical protein